MDAYHARWTISAWIFLTIGLVLGALWSYSVLGWGGYWAWDPVENVALLPWLMGTAFLHSVMVQERRGMLKVWKPVPDRRDVRADGPRDVPNAGEHPRVGSTAFAESIVGPLYLAFLTLVLLGGFGLIAWRRESLRAEATFDTPLSRESVFLGNNVLLLVLTFTVLVGTIYPLLAEAVTGGKVSVGSPFFNRNTAPSPCCSCS
jgi:cytochrome c-type biogenesis protein CcmF